MKKTITVMLALTLVLAAAAQRGHGGGRVVVVTPGIGLGYGYGYSSLFYSPYGYPYGYPYYYGNPYQTSKLQMEIADLKTDYSDKIRSAKKDKSLSKVERKATVQQLKTERNKAVQDLQKNYYKPRPATNSPADKG